MPTTLTFMGAARNVTGSRYLLESNETRILVDCGLYQEREYLSRNWEPFAVPPTTLDAVLLTHAHLDHCGLLPRLVKEGFTGRIYCTAATAEIARISLLDSAKIQEEDAEFKRKRHEREGRKGPHPEIPLYTAEDAEASFPLFRSVKYEEPVHLDGGMEAMFHNAGHILGSSTITLKFDTNHQAKTILFSGDLGRWDRPILENPTYVEESDYVVIKSTYGDRSHGSCDDIAQEIRDVINTTVEAGGNIVVPAFAIGRTQEVIYYMNQLLSNDEIPHLLVFLDSPMAIQATEVFAHHPELFDKEMLELIRRHESPFDFEGLKLVRSASESKAINRIRGSVVIIAGSGMCTGGRVKHHLATNISRPESTILFVGYQALGTLGREIVEGADKVRILGQHYDVKARVVQLSGLSAHADRDELSKWLHGLKKPPKHVFVTHGEPRTSESFAKHIEEQTGWTTSVPQYQDSVVLE